MRHDIYVSVNSVTLLQNNKYQPFSFHRRVSNIAKSDCRLRTVCLPPCPSVYMALLGSHWTDAKVLKKKKPTRNMKQQRLDPKLTTDCFQVDSQLMWSMFGKSLNTKKDDRIQSSKCSVPLHENSSPYADAHTDCERLPVRTT